MHCRDRAAAQMATPYMCWWAAQKLMAWRTLFTFTPILVAMGTGNALDKLLWSMLVCVCGWVLSETGALVHPVPPHPLSHGYGNREFA